MLSVIIMQDSLEKIRDRLDDQEETRDELLDISHRVIRKSSSAMAALHRGDRDEVSRELAESGEDIEKLNGIIDSEPQFTDHGTLIAAHREFSEVAITRALMDGEDLPDPDDLKVHYKGYAQALPEAVGELYRHVLNLLRNDRVERAEEVHETMEGLFGLIEQFDYPDSILPGMKHRRDGARNSLKETRDAVTRAVREKKLEEALKRTERSLEDRDEF